MLTNCYVMLYLYYKHKIYHINKCIIILLLSAHAHWHIYLFSYPLGILLLFSNASIVLHEPAAADHNNHEDISTVSRYSKYIL